MSSLPPGVPALIVLIVVSIVVIGVGTNNGNSPSVQVFLEKSPASTRALSTLSVAVPFWIWAVTKVIRAGDPDLGAVTFLLVIMSCALVYSQKYQQSISTKLLFVSNALVCINYLLPFFLPIDLPGSFYIYLVVGAVYWAAMCAWNWHGRWLRDEFLEISSQSPPPSEYV